MTLYIVSTPIGNLKDITFRAVDTLSSVNYILCEDTRVTSKLLSHYNITAKTVSYNDHNAASKRPKIIEDLLSGQKIALVSDAGTPLISDPGYKLASEAASSGIRIVPVPGASSVFAALVGAGVPTDKFMFLGFFDEKEASNYKNVEASLVYFESAKRLLKTLKVIAEKLPGRNVCVARELTKIYEEFIRGNAVEVAEHYVANPPKGEVVIVLHPPQAVDVTDEEIFAELKRFVGVPIKISSEIISRNMKVQKKRVYKIGVEMENKN